jgi:hypothetical protein
MSETMEETMKREQEEMLATLTRANSALSRLFNMEEGEVCDECGEIHEEDFNG